MKIARRILSPMFIFVMSIFFTFQVYAAPATVQIEEAAKGIPEKAVEELAAENPDCHIIIYSYVEAQPAPTLRVWWLAREENETAADDAEAEARNIFMLPIVKASENAFKKLLLPDYENTSI